MTDLLTSYYLSGDTIRSRGVSDIVLSDTLDIPMPPARLLADWAREVSTSLVLAPGDVEQMPLARARMRWPDYARCVQAVTEWTGAHGMPDVLSVSDVALMICRGARYHHDAVQYGGSAFCNLFVSEDKGLDVHFPVINRRIPLTRGTVLIFDTAQPHGVIQRHGGGFNAGDFPPGQDFTQLFLTWELPIEEAGVCRALRLAFDTAPADALQGDVEQVWLNGTRAEVSPESGRWHPAEERRTE
jgi:hypothetical protein